jgi:threonine/homoserine/homoserine lactone efflux protein
MVTATALGGVLVVALAIVLTPGPNMMYLVSRSITQGRRAGLISLAGVAVGFLIYLTATNLGLSALFVAVPEMYLAVKLAGVLPRMAGLQSGPARWDISLCSRRAGT